MSKKITSAVLSISLSLLVLGCAATSPKRTEMYRKALPGGPPEGQHYTSSPARSVPPLLTQEQGQTESPSLKDARGISSLPILLSADSLSLKDLLREVLQRNASLESMRATYAAALERTPQVSAFDDPMLSYSSVPSSINSSDVDYAQKITLSQKVPWPGKLSLKGDIASSIASSASQDLDALRNLVAEAVKKAYYDYYYIFRAIEINDENLEVIKQFKSVAEVKYSTGTSSKQDALQAEVRLLHLKHKGIALKRALSVAQSKINSLLNISPDTNLPAPERKLARPIPPADFRTYVEAAKENHPELKSIKAQIAAKELSVKLANKDFMPDFTLEAGYNSLWQEDDLRPVIGIGINIPLQLEKRRAKKREETSLLSSLKAKHVSKVSEIEEEIKTSIDNINEAHHVVSLYRSKLLPASKENLAAARSEYEAGEGDYLRFLTAEESYLLARLEFERALSAYHQHRAHLARAVGERPLDTEADATQEEK